MSVLARYVLYQVPGWALSVIVLAVLRRWLGLPLWAVFVLLAAYVAKDLVLYPFLRRAYESGPTGAAQLIGEVGTATEALHPTGYIRVRGELWRAKLAPGADAVPAGGRVRVQSVRGMTLTVASDTPPDVA